MRLRAVARPDRVMSTACYGNERGEGGRGEGGVSIGSVGPRFLAPAADESECPMRVHEGALRGWSRIVITESNLS